MKIIIIGAGPGGYETAVEAAKRGVQVVLIEQGEVGGTCLNEGCIPTKTLCRSAALYSDLKRAGEFGISLPDGAAPDFKKVQGRKQAVVEQLRSGVESLLRGPLITLVRGRAEVTGPHTVKVTEADKPETEEYTADYIIIATGSHPAALPIPGANLPGVLDSTAMLSIDHVPQRLCIIGAGVIGLEFACIFNSFGSKVTVVEFCPQILPNFDSDLAKRLKQSLSKSGIEIITKAAVTGISPVEAGLQVEYKLKDATAAAEADTVLMAVGRRPNVDGLGLDSVGIQYSAKGIVTDDYMRTNVESIYAIGDVNGRCMLAHAATYQGIKALNNMCWNHDGIDLSLVPAVVFTSHEAATVGLTEQDCISRGIEYTCLKSFFRANGKAVSQGETDGFIKVVIAAKEISKETMVDTDFRKVPGGVPEHDAATAPTEFWEKLHPRLGVSEHEAVTSAVSGYAPGQILGCHMFGPHASDLIAEMTALIHCRATIFDLKSIIHAHPTLSEAFGALN